MKKCCTGRRVVLKIAPMLSRTSKEVDVAANNRSNSSSSHEENSRKKAVWSCLNKKAVIV